MGGEKGCVDNQGAPILCREIVKPPPAADEPLHLSTTVVLQFDAPTRALEIQ
jgi:hypothetical protein